MFNEILERVNLKYEDLNKAEKETLQRWGGELKQKTVTLSTVKDNINAMRSGVERELIDEPEFNYIFIFKVPNRKQILLKARLKNYMMLEALLDSPKKAQEALDQAISTIVSNIK